VTASTWTRTPASSRSSLDREPRLLPRRQRASNVFRAVSRSARTPRHSGNPARTRARGQSSHAGTQGLGVGLAEPTPTPRGIGRLGLRRGRSSPGSAPAHARTREAPPPLGEEKGWDSGAGYAPRSNGADCSRARARDTPSPLGRVRLRRRHCDHGPTPQKGAASSRPQKGGRELSPASSVRGDPTVQPLRTQEQ
jgi:hypothetical protein